ncbi:hypothetical protein AVEN_181973-1 [Araneus ventricosus]|uniref:OTU domain-containing protein n=1 Tax=Araneus ventricosus TaxID=182803 RepID=A0A4Y2JVF0_ARAVE|nr:hypothetical protein AVEN_181973-1 [Araneus ventricosus]
MIPENEVSTKNLEAEVNATDEYRGEFKLTNLIYKTKWKNVVKENDDFSPVHSISNTKCDGNCLFRAFQIHICIYGSEDFQAEIREKVVQNITIRRGLFKDFIIGDLSYPRSIRSSADYEDLMSRDGEYAGHAELHRIGAISFVDITIFKGITYSTFKEAATQRGLLLNDSE